MDLLKLEIVTPEGLIFSNNVKEVTFPGSEGEFGVLPGHAALVSLLKVGVIDIELENGKHEAVAINWGHVTIDETKAIALAEGAVSVSGNSESEIAKALDDAKKLIESMSDSEVTMAAARARIESVAKSR